MRHRPGSEATKNLSIFFAGDGYIIYQPRPRDFIDLRFTPGTRVL
jgi:hypothetical protein